MSRTLLITILLTATACGSTVEPGEDTSELYVGGTLAAGEYTLVIGTPSGEAESYNRTLRGETVDTNWNEDLAFVYLNTDDFNEPLGTLTLTLGDILFQDGGSSGWVADVDFGLLSISDLRVGTSEELNARLYEVEGGAGPNEIKQIEIGDNFIRGVVELTMRFVPPPSSTIPDHIVGVQGNFVAVAN